MLDIDKNTVDFLVTENMVKEVENVIGDVFPRIDRIIDVIKEREITNVIFVACGSPLSACKTATMLFEKYSDIPCRAMSGWDFLDNPPYSLNKNTLVIGVSHYGKTEEVYESVGKAAEKGAMTIGVTRDASGNPLADLSEHVIAYDAECIWEMHLLVNYYIACRCIEWKQGDDEIEKILSDMKLLPGVLSRLVGTVEEKSRELGERAAEWPFIYTVASGPLTPLAYKEGVITMMEFTWTHGCTLNSAEFRHGPLEIVEEGVSYVVMLGNDDSRHTSQRAADFIRKYTSNIIVFDINDYETGLHPMLTPMVLFVPLEFFYYYLSISKDHNPDDRRYYGGIVEY